MVAAGTNVVVVRPDGGSGGGHGWFWFSKSLKQIFLFSMFPRNWERIFKKTENRNWITKPFLPRFLYV